MSGATVDLAGLRVFICDAEGPPLASDGAISDLIGEMFGADAELVAIPAARLPSAFFDLRTRLAGEILQKLVNYRFRVAILGDISAALAASRALQDFVGESNRGQTVWFALDVAELERRLAARART